MVASVCPRVRFAPVSIASAGSETVRLRFNLLGTRRPDGLVDSWEDEPALTGTKDGIAVWLALA